MVGLIPLGVGCGELKLIINLNSPGSLTKVTFCFYFVFDHHIIYCILTPFFSLFLFLPLTSLHIIHSVYLSHQVVLLFTWYCLKCHNHTPSILFCEATKQGLFNRNWINLNPHQSSIVFILLPIFFDSPLPALHGWVWGPPAILKEL